MADLRNSRPLETLGLPDPAKTLLEVLESKRMGPKKRAGLILYAEGVPARECAKVVGLKDHMGLWRAAKRYGLLEIHRDRQAYRDAARKTLNAQNYFQGSVKSPLGMVRASGDATDAYLLMQQRIGC